MGILRPQKARFKVGFHSPFGIEQKAQKMTGSFFNFAHRSSNIDHAVWNGAKMELLVCFKSGTNKLYSGVDADTWKGLIHAESAGKYLHRHVSSVTEGISVDRDGNPI